MSEGSDRRIERARNGRAVFKSGPFARLRFRLRTRFANPYAYTARPGRFIVSRTQKSIAALAGLTLVYGIYAGGPLGTGFLIASALPVLLLSASWQHRADAEWPVDTPRWHELLSWKLRRVSVGLVFGTEFAFIANRRFAGHGQPAAAHTSAAVGLVLFLCSPLPAILEPLLWRLSPAPWRRSERLALDNGGRRRSRRAPVHGVPLHRPP